MDLLYLVEQFLSVLLALNFFFFFLTAFHILVIIYV